jgi:hypothetical protein
MQPSFAKAPANPGARLRRVCRSWAVVTPVLVLTILAMLMTLRVGHCLAAGTHLREARPHPAALTALCSPAPDSSGLKLPSVLSDDEDDDDDDDGGDSTPC